MRLKLTLAQVALLSLCSMLAGGQSKYLNLQFNRNIIGYSTGIGIGKNITKTTSLSGGINYCLNRRQPTRPRIFANNGYSTNAIQTLEGRLGLDKKIWKTLNFNLTTNFRYCALRGATHIYTLDTLNTFLYKPALAFHLLIGPQCQVSINKNLSLNFSLSTGIGLYNHNLNYVTIQSTGETLLIAGITERIEYELVAIDNPLAFSIGCRWYY
jgi:hypothetical protein